MSTANPNGLILYGSARSPFVRKVRILLCEKGLSFLWCTDYYKFLAELNPLGKVPVLLTLDGRHIYDSPVICEYLEMVAPVPSMIPLTTADRLAVCQWQALADGICDAAVLIVNERSRDAVAERSAAWIARQQEKIERSLAIAATALESRSFCHMDTFTLADAALCSALGYISYRLPLVDWKTEFPSLSEYFSQMAIRKSISSTVPT